MYALKARDKYHKREKEREEEKREGRKARTQEQHAHHHRLAGWVEPAVGGAKPEQVLQIQFD